MLTVTSGIGCKQYYNGSLGIAGEDFAAVRAYHDHMADREQALVDRETAESQARQANRINSGGETVPIEPGTPPGPVPGDLQEALDAQLKTPGQTTPRPGEFVSTSEITPGGNTPSPSSRTAMSPIDVFGMLPGGDTPVSPLDTTGQVERVSNTEEGADFDVTTDPTGRWLLFSSTRHRQTADIYRQQIGGTAVTQLTDDPANDMMPVVSPDGKRIAFTSDRSGNWDIYLMDAEGGVAVQVTSDAAHDIHPSFSPDGKQLVYCSFGQRSGQWQMVVVEVDNPATKRYIGHGLFPQWSPSGGTILFQRARERGTRWFSVWTVELDEQGEAGSPTEIAWSPSHACITPAWSPDGKHVVFCTVSDPEADSQARPKASDVWVVEASGRGRTRLTQGRFSNLQPVWSTGGSIYFVSNRGRQGVENIYAVNPDDAVYLVGGEDETDESTATVPPNSD
ncbi:MAG: DPP IV N-terminal domain-containing protein [Planctomycetota bacterium]